jgi:ATP-binding cassette subfamily B (MDR/TAP) protein 1
MNKEDTPPAVEQQEIHITEETIHKAEELQLKDTNEPKPRSWMQILPIIGWDILWIVVGIFFACCTGCIPLVFYWILGSSFASISFASSDSIGATTQQLGLSITYIAIAAFFCSFISNFCFTFGAQRIKNRVQLAYFTKVMEQEIGFFDLKKTGALMHAVGDDATKFTDMFEAHLLTVVTNGTQAVVGFVLAMISDWAMTLLLMAGVPIVAIMNILSRPLMAHIVTIISKQNAASMATASEVITSIKTVRSMAGEEKERKRYFNQIEKVVKIGLVSACIRAINSLISVFLIFGAVGLSFWYGGIQLSKGNVDISHFIRVFGIGVITVIGILFVIVKFPELVKSQAAAMILLKVILRKPKIRFRGGEMLEEINGHISFKNVTFRYPTRPKVAVLTNFNLEIQPGTSVALVGQSGSGKSTIVGLLQRFYEQEQGTVEIDHMDIREMDPVWLHRYLGIVSQEPTLFATTIRKNISYAVDTINGHIRTFMLKQKKTEQEIQAKLVPVTQELIENAARAANAHTFIESLPDGYDTLIGERGVSLSGGQKQRVAIARAVLQNPKILLLDEATSALDTKSEALVQDALEKLMVGRTSIVIAHRLTTIQNCDCIVVMKQGVVVEVGKHDDMIQNQSGAYYALASKQIKMGTVETESSESVESELDEQSEESFIEQEPEPEPVPANVSTAPEIEPEPTPVQQPEKKKRRKKKKSLHDAEIVDPREPRLKNPLKMFKLVGPECLLIVIGSIAAIGIGSVPIFNFMFFGNIITASSGSTRNSDGALVPYPPGYSIYDEVARQASYISIVAGLGAIAQMINNFCMVYNTERVAVRMRKIFFASLLKQEMSFFDIKKSGVILSMIGEDISTGSAGLVIKGSMFAQQSGQFLVGIIVALTASWQTALVILAAGAPTIGILIVFSSFFINFYNKRTMHLSSRCMGVASEVFGAIRTVRSMAGEERERERFASDLRTISRATLFRALATATMMGGIQFCIWAIAALAFWYGGMLVANGTLAPGSLIQVFGNMMLAVTGASLALNEVQHFYKSFASIKNVQKVTERVPAISCKSGIKPNSIHGNVEFKDITFAYPSRPNVTVMKDFNLTINNGQHIALVGESGSGKSTITGLLERFYDPTQGQVLLDGVDLKTIDLTWLHKNIAIVTQEPTLFATTIKRNITYALDDENVSMERIIECAKAANCHEFIMSLPSQYDTMIGERGVSMSGGQKQRIAIARAMIQNASLLILDEATSALDSTSESLVQEALDKLTVGKTTIVIAHRLSTVKNCDAIVVMKQGQVMEMGTHNELIQKKGSMYYKLAHKQMEFGNMKKGKQVTITEND